MQALEAEAKSAGASGDDAKEDGKRELAQMIATRGCAFVLTDAVQDCSAAEQKRILVERGQELFNAPEEAVDEYDGMADYVNDCDALIAFMEAENCADICDFRSRDTQRGAVD
jgi:hypothetical protein